MPNRLGSVVDSDGHVLESVQEFATFGWTGVPTSDPTVDHMLYQPVDVKRHGL
jgi:hypothetical protein